MKIKTVELSGYALGAAVAMALGHTFGPYRAEFRSADDECRKHSVMFYNGNEAEHFACMRCQKDQIDYHDSWEHAGPIIEREKLDTAYLSRQGEWYCYRKNRNVDDTIVNSGFGPTPLIAAMRCFVASKLGDEVEIPKELV